MDTKHVLLAAEIGWNAGRPDVIADAFTCISALRDLTGRVCGVGLRLQALVAVLSGRALQHVLPSWRRIVHAVGKSFDGLIRPIIEPPVKHAPRNVLGTLHTVDHCCIAASGSSLGIEIPTREHEHVVDTRQRHIGAIRKCEVARRRTANGSNRLL